MQSIGLLQDVIQVERPGLSKQLTDYPFQDLQLLDDQLVRFRLSDQTDFQQNVFRPREWQFTGLHHITSPLDGPLGDPETHFLHLLESSLEAKVRQSVVIGLTFLNAVQPTTDKGRNAVITFSGMNDCIHPPEIIWSICTYIIMQLDREPGSVSFEELRVFFRCSAPLVVDGNLSVQYALLTCFCALVLQSKAREVLRAIQEDKTVDAALGKLACNCALSRKPYMYKIGRFCLLMFASTVQTTTGIAPQESDTNALVLRALAMQRPSRPPVRPAELYRSQFLAWCWFKITCATQNLEKNVMPSLVYQASQQEWIRSTFLMETLKLFIAPEEQTLTQVLAQTERHFTDILTPKQDASQTQFDGAFLDFIVRNYSRVPSQKAWQSVFSLSE